MSTTISCNHCTHTVTSDDAMEALEASDRLIASKHPETNGGEGAVSGVLCRWCGSVHGPVGNCDSCDRRAYLAGGGLCCQCHHDNKETP